MSSPGHPEPTDVAEPTQGPTAPSGVGSANQPTVLRSSLARENELLSNADHLLRNAWNLEDDAAPWATEAAAYVALAAELRVRRWTPEPNPLT